MTRMRNFLALYRLFRHHHPRPAAARYALAVSGHSKQRRKT
jgi:hypothetical protein